MDAFHASTKDGSALSGEVRSGPFCKNIRGLLFTTPENLALLHNNDDTRFSLNACDQRSMCGLKYGDIDLPARRRTT